MPRVSDPMEVKLEPHRAWETNAAIPGWIDFDQYQVFVYSEGLAHRNEAKRLMVGLIGKKPGSQFCPTGEFDSFVFAHQQFIVSEVKKLHGSASPAPHTPLPPPLSELQAESEEPDEENPTVES